RDRLGPYRRLLWWIVGLQIVQTVAGLLLPTINARVIDNGVLLGDVGYIWTWGAVMLFFALVQGAFAIGAMFVGARVAMSFGRDVRARLFHQVTDFSAREVGAFGAPSLITRITNDVQQVQLLVVMGCTMAIAAPITMVVGVVMALREDVGLSIVLVIAVPVAAVVVGVLVAVMVPSFRRMQERIDQINRILREQITGIRVVRAFVREPEERERFGVANEELTVVSARAGRLMSAIFPTMNVVVNLASTAVLWIGADRIASGQMQIGVVVAYLTYLVQILMSVLLATFVVSMIPRAAVSSGRIMAVLDTTVSVVPPAAPVRAMTAPGSVEFDDVAFHYPGAESAVLSGISFRTEPGRTTAIVGSTGGGKTTLVNLIPRLFDATSGTVRVGGVDVRDLDPELLWGTVGLVPQRPYLFAGTVASNLRYGKPDASEEELWDALAVAQARDFVARMPGGLDARIEQGGSNVSGGQRQRLSIARALVHEPDLFVFDDSFSALDLATDARLRAALAPRTRAAAVVIVAQRVSTIVGADEILVLEGGQLVGRGRHDDLLAGCETYAEIVQSQIGTREEPAA
ncbi:MAG TPA: ABC transporter ATP-binding protein, partial [Candidatus Limnocylindrales bacterium]